MHSCFKDRTNLYQVDIECEDPEYFGSIVQFEWSHNIVILV